MKLRCASPRVPGQLRHLLSARELTHAAFDSVVSFIEHGYRTSRRAHSLILAPEMLRVPSVELDGAAGSALLRELRCRHSSVFRGSIEFFKRMLLWACLLLKIPVAVFPSGRLTLGLQPVGAEPSVAVALRRLVGRLELPQSVEELVLSFAGDVWWRCEATADPPPPERNARRFVIEPSSASLRRLLRKTVGRASCWLVFSDRGRLHASWGEQRSRLYLQGLGDPWPFVTLLRCVRRRLGMPSEVLTILGFGEVLV